MSGADARAVVGWVGEALSSESFFRVVLVLVGAGVTWFIGRRTERQRERRHRTAEFATEYLDPKFIPIRAAAGDLTRMLHQQTLHRRDLAAGFWFPGRPDSFSGELVDRVGLTPHELLTVYLDFYKRLGFAIENDLVDRNGLSLLSDLSWSAYLMSELCAEIVIQAEEDGYAPPAWVRYVETTLTSVPMDPSARKGPAPGWLVSKGPVAPVRGRRRGAIRGRRG